MADAAEPDSIDGSSKAASWRERYRSVQSEFGWFLAAAEGLKPAPHVDRIFIRAIEESWVDPNALVLPIIRYLTAKWPNALSSNASISETELFDVVRDPLTLAMLRSTPTATPGFEKLLARIRFGCLRTLSAGGDISDLIPTMLALAIRGRHSGYALTLPFENRENAARMEEIRLTDDLKNKLETRRYDDSIGAALAVYAAYACPEPAYIETALAAGDPVAISLHEHVVAPIEGQRLIARDLIPVTPIDEAQLTVADQYEQHPYPAWIAEPGDGLALPPAVIAALGKEGVDSVTSVLVAGSGTGQHALIAARAWPRADILAIDISRTSLAYAIDRNRGEDSGRISFALADLMQVEQLGRRFQVIESMGVLHHLADPEAGLAALKCVLEPGGIIGIALYSAAARRDLETIRKHYGKSDVRSDDEVRDFRAWALAHLGRHPLLYSADFYSIGGCRDAFFHVRERCYSLPEISEMLDRAGLRLLAVQTPPTAKGRLDPVPEPTDITGWAHAEAAYCDLFIGMYEIWAQA